MRIGRTVVFLGACGGLAYLILGEGGLNINLHGLIPQDAADPAPIEAEAEQETAATGRILIRGERIYHGTEEITPEEACALFAEDETPLVILRADDARVSAEEALANACTAQGRAFLFLDIGRERP